MRIAALLLAAGASRRFGAADKLLAKVDGVSVIERVARAIEPSRIGRTLAVVRPGAIDVKRTLARYHWLSVANPEPDRGIGSSIARGVTLISTAPDSDGVLIVPGDMPWLSTALIDAVIELFEDRGGERVIVPTLPGGGQRNPVLWPRSLFPRLAMLDGDRGAKHILAEPGIAVTPLEWHDARAFLDIGTPDDLAPQR